MEALEEKVRLIDDRLPLTFRWFSGLRMPPAGPQEVIWYEDEQNEVGKIIMRRSNKTYVFVSYQAEPGEPSDITISPNKHAHRHATGGDDLARTDVGADPIGPYTFTWTKAHTWTPSTAATTPITVTLASSQTADAMVVQSSAGDRIFTIDSTDSVGVNEDDPQAHLVVQQTGFDPLTLSPYMWFKADSLSLSNNDPVTTWQDSSGNGRHLSSPSGLILYKTNQSNGYPGVFFSLDGTAHVPRFEAIAGSPHVLKALTVFVVWARDAAADATHTTVHLFSNVDFTDYLSLPTGGGRRSWEGKSSSTPGFVMNSANVFAANPGGNIDAQSFHVHAIINTDTINESPADITAYKDGTSVGTASGNDWASSDSEGGAPVVPNPTHWTYFYGPAVDIGVFGSGWCDGTVLEVLVWNTALGTTDRQSIESYLNAKYNLNGGGSGGALKSIQYWQDSNAAVKAEVDTNGDFELHSQGEIHFYEADDTNYVGFKGASTIAANLTWILPNADGTSNQVLKTDGALTLSWANALLSVPTDSGTATPSAGTISLIGSTGISTSASGATVTLTLDTDLQEISAVANVLGDILYTDATPSWTRLAGNTTTTLQVLTQTGTGAVSAAPVWASLATAGAATTFATDSGSATPSAGTITITGGTGIATSGAGSTVTLTIGAGTGITVNANDVALTVPVVLANGGTGLTSYTAGDTLYFDSGTAFTKLGIDTVGKIYRSTGTAPAWSNFTMSPSYSSGDILYALSANALAGLTIAGTSGRILRSDGSSPSWATLATAGIVGGTGTEFKAVRWAAGGVTIEDGGDWVHKHTWTQEGDAAPVEMILLDRDILDPDNEFVSRDSPWINWQARSYDNVAADLTANVRARTLIDTPAGAAAGSTNWSWTLEKSINGGAWSAMLKIRDDGRINHSLTSLDFRNPVQITSTSLSLTGSGNTLSLSGTAITGTILSDTAASTFLFDSAKTGSGYAFAFKQTGSASGGHTVWENSSGADLMALSSNGAPSAAFGTPGTLVALVGTTNSDTLTNKTITSNTNNVMAKGLYSPTDATNCVITSSNADPGKVIRAFSNTVCAWSDTADIGYYGDGSDGAATLNGGAAPTGMVKSSGGNDYRLTRDVFYTNLTINSSNTLYTNSKRIFCTGTLTVNGTLRTGTLAAGDAAPAVYTGSAGSGTTGGSQGATISGDSIGGGSAAGAGGNVATNGGVSNAATGDSGAGGAGGAGGGGGGSGGTAGTFTTWRFRIFGQTLILKGISNLNGGQGGTGGGGGAGASGGGGGGGGSGAGVMGLWCRYIDIDTATGTITVAGHAGGNGAPGGAVGSSGGGGGGGGGGGLLYVFSDTDILGTTPTITTSADGGAKGTGGASGGGGGSAGADGNDGSVGTKVWVNRLTGTIDTAW